MNKNGYILYDTLIAITVILLFVLPVSKSANLTEVNIKNYQENHLLNETTEIWVSKILSSDYVLESEDYIIEDEIFSIYVVSKDTEYAAIKKINISVQYNDDNGSYDSDCRNSAEIYKYIGES